MTSEKDLKKLLINSDIFIGTYSSEKLPTFPHIDSVPKAMIVNIVEEGGKSGHWVAILMTKLECLFFDSTGRKLKETNLIEYLSAHYDYVVFNPNRLQHVKSDKCGQFCALFVMCVKNSCDFKKFVNSFFRCDLMKNDLVLQVYFENKMI